MRTILSGVLAGALLAATPAAAVAAPTKNVPPPQSFPAPAPSGSTQQGELAPAPPMNVSVQTDEIARAGGRGSVYIPLVRDQRGKALRNVRITVDSPKGTRINRVSATGWNCAPGGRTAICTLRKSVLPAGRNPQQLYTVISVNRSYRKATARIMATATWQGSKVRRSPQSSSFEYSS